MPKRNKTISVQTIKDTVNGFLAQSTCSRDRRQGQIDVITDILMSSGNYHGFTYLWKNDVPIGEKPGIVVNSTIEDTPIEVRFDPKHSDPTRVKFF